MPDATRASKMACFASVLMAAASCRPSRNVTSRTATSGHAGRHDADLGLGSAHRCGRGILGLLGVGRLGCRHADHLPSTHHDRLRAGERVAYNSVHARRCRSAEGMTLPPIPDTAADITAGWLTAVLGAGGHCEGAQVASVERATVGHRPDVRQRPAHAHLRRAHRRAGVVGGQAAGRRRHEPVHRRGDAAATRRRCASTSELAADASRRDAPACSTPTSTTETCRASSCCSRTSRPPSRATSSPGARPGWPRPRCRSSSASTRRGGAMPGSTDWSGCTATATPAAQVVGDAPARRSGRGSRSATRPSSRRTCSRPATRCSATWPPTSRPRAVRETVVHGDYRLDNLLIAPDGSVRGVVDWQTCTVGAGAQRRRLLHRRRARGRRPARARGGPRARLPRRPASRPGSTGYGWDDVLDRLPPRHLRRAAHGRRARR